MKPITYKVCDAVDALVIGAEYSAEPSGRMIRFINSSTGTTLHVWPHDVQRALCRGALKRIDENEAPVSHLPH